MGYPWDPRQAPGPARGTAGRPTRSTSLGGQSPTDTPPWRPPQSAWDVFSQRPSLRGKYNSQTKQFNEGVGNPQYGGNKTWHMAPYANSRPVSRSIGMTPGRPQQREQFDPNAFFAQWRTGSATPPQAPAYTPWQRGGGSQSRWQNAWQPNSGQQNNPTLAPPANNNYPAWTPPNQAGGQARDEAPPRGGVVTPSTPRQNRGNATAGGGMVDPRRGGNSRNAQIPTQQNRKAFVARGTPTPATPTSGTASGGMVGPNRPAPTFSNQAAETAPRGNRNAETASGGMVPPRRGGNSLDAPTLAARGAPSQQPYPTPQNRNSTASQGTPPPPNAPPGAASGGMIGPNRPAPTLSNQAAETVPRGGISTPANTSGGGGVTTVPTSGQDMSRTQTTSPWQTSSPSGGAGNTTGTARSVAEASRHQFDNRMYGEMTDAGRRLGQSGFSMSTPYASALGQAEATRDLDMQAMYEQYAFQENQADMDRELQRWATQGGWDNQKSMQENQLEFERWATEGGWNQADIDRVWRGDQAGMDRDLSRWQTQGGWGQQGLDRDWRGEQAGLDRAFQGGQAGMDRDLSRWQTQGQWDQAGLDRDWRGSQAGLDRAFQGDQAGLNRAFQGSQAGMDRDLSRWQTQGQWDYGAGQAAQDRDYQQWAQQGQWDYGAGQSALDRDYNQWAQQGAWNQADLGRDYQRWAQEGSWNQANQDRDYNQWAQQGQWDYGMDQLGMQQDYGAWQSQNQWNQQQYMNDLSSWAQQNGIDQSWLASALQAMQYGM